MRLRDLVKIKWTVRDDLFMSGLSKAAGSMMLFLLTVLTYTPLKGELVTVAANATLTNAGVEILNTMFGLIWILMAIMWLLLSMYYALK